MIRIALREAGSSGLFLRAALLALGAAAVLLPNQSSANDFCPDIYKKGVFPLNFNPAFMHIDSFNAPNGNSYDGLIVTSFFNAIKNEEGTTRVGFFERDLVARITGIGYRSPSWFNKDRDVEVLSDLDVEDPVFANGPGQTVWPNEAQRVPDGILPFEAIVVPEGFHPTPEPGRLTLINLDDPARTTYLIDQSLQNTNTSETGGTGRCRLPNDPQYDPNVAPRFYHLVKWVDMDNDGLKDAVTVRSGFKVSGAFCITQPIVGEVVWFKNPGGAIDPDIEWAEYLISGYPDVIDSADISLDVADLEGDGVPEIVGSNFFTGERLTLYGAPVGGDWTDVDPATNPPRYAIISDDQGAPFQSTFADLNLDGKIDVFATNHQSDGCFPRTQDVIPGRVYALEQPASGDIFNDPWVTHILKDDIRPNPTYPAPNNDPAGPGRLAPGLAQVFWPTPWDEFANKPWLLVGGDEASRVWLLKPQSQDPNDWNYDSATIFDINDYYGPNTTQSFTAPPPATGVSISTIGGPAWRYDRDWAWGSYAEIYIPVFEGRDIHRISFRPSSASQKVTCPADLTLACPVF
jgi:hypothetical protein